jgi:hypothetical protein
VLKNPIVARNNLWHSHEMKVVFLFTLFQHYAKTAWLDDQNINKIKETQDPNIKTLIT